MHPGSLSVKVLLHVDNTAAGRNRVRVIPGATETYQQTMKIQAQRVVEYQIEDKSKAPTELQKEAVNGIMMCVSRDTLGAVEFAITGGRCWWSQRGCSSRSFERKAGNRGVMCWIPMGFVPTRPGRRGRRNNHPGNGQFRVDRAVWPGTCAQGPCCLSRRRFSFYGNFVIADKNAQYCGSLRVSMRCYHT